MSIEPFRHFFYLFVRLLFDICCIPISNTTSSLNHPNHPNPIFWYLYWMPFCWMAAAQMIFPAVCFAGNHCLCVVGVGLIPYVGYCALTGLGIVVGRDFGLVFRFFEGIKKCRNVH